MTETRTFPPVEVVLPGLVEPDGLEIRQQVAREPGGGRVIVAMEATGVSFAEQQMRRGRYYDQPTFPFVPGYDVVGRVVSIGEGVDAALLGRRVAAITKIGAWADRVEVEAVDLIPVPDDIDAATIEALIVNGVTAWQMLHRLARPRPGGTAVVLGANGGVGNVLAQLAVHEGMRVIGTASARHHDALRAMGVEPVDHHDSDAAAKIRLRAPEGVDAVFDHVGGRGLTGSWRLLRRGGTLVSYGTASTKDDTGNARWPILVIFARLALWNLVPNGRSARFFDLWAGRRRRVRFIARQREALDAVLRLVEDGHLAPRIAARFPLREAPAALRAAESHRYAGKIVLLGAAADESGRR